MHRPIVIAEETHTAQEGVLMKITGTHPTGAKVEITSNPSGSGTYDLSCWCSSGLMTHADWYSSVDECKRVARLKSFTASELIAGKHKGRWKWTKDVL